jgi:hypothetical protein
MKHLKSSGTELRQLFERSIAVREIAEPLVSFDSNQDQHWVLQFMAERNYDLVGVRAHGLVSGYARKSDLGQSGRLEEQLRSFGEEHVLHDGDSILSAMRILKTAPAVFVAHLGRVHGIVTRGDLQKTPVRMWLFGLISMIEMQLSRLVRAFYPDETWRDLLSNERLDNLHRVYAERNRRNEAIDLADCLQLCDKAALVLKNPSFRQSSPFPSKAAGDRFFKNLEGTRNALAHSQDIITGKWPSLAELAVEAETLLHSLERTR